MCFSTSTCTTLYELDEVSIEKKWYVEEGDRQQVSEAASGVR